MGSSVSTRLNQAKSSEMPEKPVFQLKWEQDPPFCIFLHYDQHGHAIKMGLLTERRPVGVLPGPTKAINYHKQLKRPLFNNKAMREVQGFFLNVLDGKKEVFVSSIFSMKDYNLKNYPEMVGKVVKMKTTSEPKDGERTEKVKYAVKWMFEEADLKHFPELKDYFIKRMKSLLGDNFPDNCTTPLTASSMDMNHVRFN